jgi:hypothetical protein
MKKKSPVNRVQKRIKMGENVIGPIDHATWYCMRQCKESIRWCKSQNNAKYQVEIEGEKALLSTFMDEVFGRKAA